MEPVDAKSAILEAFLKYVMPTLLTVIGAAVALLLARAGQWLNEKAKTSKIAAVGEKLFNVGSAVVHHVETELRPEVQKAIADGVVTPEEGAHLKKRAMDLFKEALGANGIKELGSVLGVVGGSVEVFLSGVLEKALNVKKLAEASVDAATATTAVAEARAEVLSANP